MGHLIDILDAVVFMLPVAAAAAGALTARISPS